MYWHDLTAVPSVGIQPGQHALVLGSNMHPPKVRWQAPSAMEIDINGVFTAGNWAEVLVSVIKNDTTFLFTDSSTSDIVFNLSTTVNAGDTIDFVLREASDFNGSHTGLEASITRRLDYLAGDINKDYSVDLLDFAEMAQDWLTCNDLSNSGCSP